VSTTTKTFNVPFTFDGWTVPLDVEASVTWTLDPGCYRTANGDGWPASSDIDSVTISATAADLHPQIVEAWGEDFPDVPCPIDVAAVERAFKAAKEHIADTFEIPADDDDANLADFHAEDRAEIARWEMEDNQ